MADLFLLPDLTCPTCGNVYGNLKSLQAHKRTCGKKKQCLFCGKMIINVPRHMRDVHPKEFEKRQQEIADGLLKSSS